MTVSLMPPRPRAIGPDHWDGLDRAEVDFTEPAAEEETGWVDAAPFRAHLRMLLSQSGLPWRTVATLAEVPANSVHALLRGPHGRPVRRIHPLMARRLIYLTPAAIADAADRQLPATEAIALLRPLTAIGWTMPQLARLTGLTEAELAALADARQSVCTLLALATIRAAAQVLLSGSSPVAATPQAPAEAASTGYGHELAA